MHSQCVRHEEEMAELHLLAGFHALNCRPVKSAGVGEALLGHVLVQPSDAYAVAGGSARVEDPLGVFGWHSTNRLRTKIISQQQICRTVRS